MKNKESHYKDIYLDVEESESRPTQKRTVLYLLRYILHFKTLVFAGILMILVSTSAILLEPRIFGYAIDEAIIPKRWSYLKQLTLLFFFVECFRVGAMIAQGYLFECLGQNVMQKLRIALFSHLQIIPVSVYDKHSVGKLVTRVTNDVSALAEMFTSGFVTMFGNILVVFGIVIWLLVLNFKLGLIAVSIFPFLLVSTYYFTDKLRVAYRNARSKLSALNAFLAENILGVKVVQLFNRQKLHLSRFNRINHWYSEAQIGTVKLYAYFQPTITIAAGISMALVIWYGSKMALSSEIKLGILVAFFSYIQALFQPIRDIADKWNIFLSGITSAERIFSILDWKTEINPETGLRATQSDPSILGHIVFENVWFAYNEPNWVLKDFTFEIKPGMKVGVVGHTGAGKTTIISLLMRFYDPQKGRILLDGKDLRSYDKRTLRASLGLVQQDVFLFSGSTLDNITLWKEPTDFMSEKIFSTLSVLGLSRWLNQSASALDERGSNLSMGERQVIAFTRALASDPKIWILDEASANIDSDTEEKMAEVLSVTAQGKTQVWIAHRMATVRNADIILVLNKGLLVEKGNHHELMTKKGIYAKLYEFQEYFQSEELETASEFVPNSI